jgi:hypothetical protein
VARRTSADGAGDAALRKLPRSYSRIAAALSEVIRSEAPGLKEAVKWGNPFWIGHRDVLCLQCYPDHVNLGLLRGADLAGSHPEVEGTGKSMRHVKVPTVAVARSAAIRRLVRAAAALDRAVA